MKKVSCFKRLALPHALLSPCLAGLFFLGVPLPAQGGEVLSLDGGPGSLALGLDPFWSGDALYPAGLSGNTVLVTQGTLSGPVYGGGSTDTDQAVFDNTVDISNVPVSGDIFGGISLGDVTSNKVTLTDTTVTGYVYGGEGNANANEVTITGGSVGQSVYGGYTTNYASYVAANRVNISNAAVGESVHGGKARWGGDANANEVTITGGSVDGWVSGGSGRNANANRVDLSNVTVGKSVYGGHSSAQGADNNTVTITGGLVGSHEYGGSVYGGYADTGNATNNTVIINGATVNGAVMGGVAYYSDYYNYSATGNTVVLSGDLTVSSSIYGGNVYYRPESLILNRKIPIQNKIAPYAVSLPISSDAFTGNSLTVMNPISTPVKTVGNFEFYRFFLPATPQDTPMLTATEQVDLTNGRTGADLKVAKVKSLDIATGGAAATNGDKYVLIRSGNGTVVGAEMIGDYAPHQIKAKKGISLIYDLDVARDGAYDLVATVANVQVNPQTQALPAGRLSVLAFLNQGASLAASRAMDAAYDPCNTTMIQDEEFAPNRLDPSCGNNNKTGFRGFAAVSAGSSLYETDSPMELDSALMVAGVAFHTPVEDNPLLISGFLEAGWGSYTSYSVYNTGRSPRLVEAKGDINSWGGGLLARYDLTEGPLAGLYTEASLRAGYVETDFFTNGFVDASGRVSGSYEGGSIYYGAHAGLGYVFQLSDQANLDLFTKYLWTHLDGETVTVNGDPIRFKGAESHRWLGGARLDYTMATDSGVQITPYVSAAYEYEFDGNVRASAYNLDIKSSSLGGGTGIGEVGIRITPDGDSGFSANLGMQGYVGMREGISGTFKLTYAF